MFQANGTFRIPSSVGSSPPIPRVPSLFVLLLLLLAAGAILAATATATRPPGAFWDPQVSPTHSDLRGVSAPSDGVAWASGTKGAFLRTEDGGKTWTAGAVPGAETLDFRDVEAFDKRSAVIMSAGPGSASRIYRTADGGARWDLALENPDQPKGFFDAIAFWDRSRGLALGDPVDGRFVLFATEDGGSHWTRIPPEGLPPALAGEGAFAASGTCLAVGPDGRAWFGTGGGGAAGRVFRSEDRGRTWRTAPSGIPASTESSGVFSLAFRDALHGIAVGGNYRVPRGSGPSIARTEDGGATWSAAAPAPLSPYYSAISVVPGTAPLVLVATGPTATAWSSDGGRTWNGREPSAEAAYNATAFSGPLFGWAVGPAGNLGRFSQRISAGWSRKKAETREGSGPAPVDRSPLPKGGAFR